MYKNELLQSKHAPTVRLLSVVWVTKITIDNFIIIRTLAITCTNLSINYAFLRIKIYVNIRSFRYLVRHCVTCIVVFVQMCICLCYPNCGSKLYIITFVCK